MGLTAEVIDVLPEGHPIVAAESNAAPGRPHLTIYGHYDVQPPDPIDLWESPPFVPAVRDGHLYARGAADNKGNHMAAVKAVEHLVASGGLPVNLRFVLELTRGAREAIAHGTFTAYKRDALARLHAWDR